MRKLTILAMPIIVMLFIMSTPHDTVQAQTQAQAQLKFAQKYQPHYFQHMQEPWPMKKSISFYIWRDGAKIRPHKRTPLPPECWAIIYWFDWIGEDDYDNKGRDKRLDPEPVIIFVKDDGNIVGMQSRIHGIWLPIAMPTIIDIHSKTHVMVGFAGWPVEIAKLAGIPRPKNPQKRYWYVHSPLCGQMGIQWIKFNGGAREIGHFYRLMPLPKGNLSLRMRDIRESRRTP